MEHAPYPPCLFDQLVEVRVQLAQLQKDKHELEAKVKKLEEQESLRKPVQEHLKVAFSAGMPSATVTVGPFNAHTPLVFTHVITNIGNAYNSATGTFTAPVRGAYHFEFFHIGGGDSVLTSAVLVKNGEHIVSTCEKQGKGFGTAANGVSLLLEAGDVVGLHLWPGTSIYENEHRHNTFSGRLLFTM